MAPAWALRGMCEFRSGRTRGRARTSTGRSGSAYGPTTTWARGPLPPRGSADAAGSLRARHRPLKMVAYQKTSPELDVACGLVLLRRKLLPAAIPEADRELVREAGAAYCLNLGRHPTRPCRGSTGSSRRTRASATSTTAAASPRPAREGRGARGLPQGVRALPGRRAVEGRAVLRAPRPRPGRGGGRARGGGGPARPRRLRDAPRARARPRRHGPPGPAIQELRTAAALDTRIPEIHSRCRALSPRPGASRRPRRR